MARYTIFVRLLASRFPGVARLWLVMTLAGIVEILASGGVHDPLVLLPGAMDGAISAETSDSNPRPADKVQSGAALDLGAAVSATELDLPVSSGLQPFAPTVLGQCRPGFRERILRPPRPIA